MERQALRSASDSCPASWATSRTPSRQTYGGAAAAVSELFGRPFMPWQRQVADVALEVLPDGRWAYQTIVVTVPRQAGKTAWLESLMVHRGQLLTLGSMWLTAQTGKKARQRFLAMAERVNLWQATEGVRMFSSNIGVSHEMLRWTETGSKLFPFAPEGSKDKSEDMHGETPDLISADEIWVHSLETAKKLQQAYVPGMGTKNSQELLTSTQGDETSEWLNSLTDLGRQLVEQGRNSGFAYFEWSIPKHIQVNDRPVPVKELSDTELLDLICKHHPAVGFTWTRETVAGHLERFTSMNDREGFIRGYGNLRLAGGAARDLAAAIWEGASSTLELPDHYALGLAYEELDPGHVQLGAAGRLANGQAVLELVPMEGVNGWLVRPDGERVDPVEYVVDLLQEERGARAVAVMNTGPGRLAADRLEAAGVPVHRIPVADYRAACPTLEADLGRRMAVHRDQPTLNKAAERVTFTRTPSGFAWTAPSKDHPVSALASVTLALLASDRPAVELPDAEFRIY